MTISEDIDGMIGPVLAGELGTTVTLHFSIDHYDRTTAGTSQLVPQDQDVRVSSPEPNSWSNSADPLVSTRQVKFSLLAADLVGEIAPQQVPNTLTAKALTINGRKYTVTEAERLMCGDILQGYTVTAKK